jgi:hypothetical protein
MKVERNRGGGLGTGVEGSKFLTADNRDPGKWHGNDILYRENGYGSKEQMAQGGDTAVISRIGSDGGELLGVNLRCSSVGLGVKD